jgi:four helix bundle protein
MRFEAWEKTVGSTISADPVWRMKAYRLALFLTEAVCRDVAPMEEQRACAALVPQLSLAVASIGSNIAEGYSRATGRDRARFFEYALGSTRESRHLYLAARTAFSSEDLYARIEILDEITRLLVTMVKSQRSTTQSR